MPMTHTQRREILLRLITKAHAGQMDGDELLDAITSALEGDRSALTALAAAERTQWQADLTAAKAAATAQAAEIEAKLVELG